MTIAGTRYITRQGDMLDLVCRRHYGTEHGTTETVLSVNPGLAARGPLFVEGITIFLPEIDTSPPPVAASINLWD